MSVFSKQRDNDIRLCLVTVCLVLAFIEPSDNPTSGAVFGICSPLKLLQVSRSLYNLIIARFCRHTPAAQPGTHSDTDRLTQTHLARLQRPGSRPRRAPLASFFRDTPIVRDDLPFRYSTSLLGQPGSPSSSLVLVLLPTIIYDYNWEAHVRLLHLL